MTRETSESFKKTFFDLPSREFGETYMQEILYSVLGDSPYTEGREVDALRNETLKGEYKCVRVLYENEKFKNETLFNKIMSHKPMSMRIATLDDIRKGVVKSNFQNIKLDINQNFDFDYMDYVLVSDEGITIFEITGTQMGDFVKCNQFPNWSSKHGRKETGLNGQFTITKGNIQWHFDNTFKKFLTWEEAIEILSKIEKR